MKNDIQWRSEAARSLVGEVPGRDPREAIEAKAREVVDELGLMAPPFDPRVVASFCGIDEIREVPLDLAGCIVPVGDPPRIQMLLRVQDPPARRNFTCAHETAHTLIPSFWQGPLERRDRRTGQYRPNQEEEYLCDVAAAELLMPREAFAWAAYEHGVSAQGVQPLSDLFGTSLEATARRLVDLKLWSGGVILWEPGWTLAQQREHDRHGVPLPERKLRVRFSHLGESLGKAFVPRRRSVRDGSLVAECFRTGAPTAGYEEIPVGSSWRMAYVRSVALGAGPQRKVLSFVSAEERV